jgi:AraC-like DNA-binding protein
VIYQELASDNSAVASFWRFALEPQDPSPVDHSIPPDGTVSIAWIPRFGVLSMVGPRMESLRIQAHAGVDYFGVRFRPGAAGSVLSLKIANFRDRIVPFAEAAPDKAARLAADLRQAPADLAGIVAVFATHMDEWQRSAVNEPDLVVRQLVDHLLNSQPEEVSRIADFATSSGLSYRQLLRRFNDAVGLTPKEFARLRRVRIACIQALEATNGLRWADVSADSGFADQAHLSREFSRTFGWPPTLVIEYLRRIEHVGVQKI